MPLFQSPPRTADEIERSKPVELSPEEVGELDEHDWRSRVFRGESAQLTVRAIVMGSALGFLLAFTNLYVGLKTGWGLGVALTACIASFTLWSTLLRIGVANSPMTILENNCMQSTASSAGYSTGPFLVTAAPAMLLLSVSPGNPRGTQLHWPLVVVWVFLVAALGVFMAIPMKRGMINRERLKFPSGTAAAVLLQSLYSQGSDALAKGRALLASGALGALVPLLTSLNVIKTVNAVGHTVRRSILPSESAIFDWIGRLHVRRLDPRTGLVTGMAYPLSAWHVVLDHSVLLVASGAIIGLRVTLSMVAGGALLISTIGPMALGWTWINPLGHVVAAASRASSAWKEIGVWFGAPLMVAYALTGFVLDFKVVTRAVANLFRSRTSFPAEATDIEVPLTWCLVGTGITGTALVVLAKSAFDIPIAYGVLAVGLTFFLTLVACRATGETDITPMGAMGKITQLAYGALMPQSYTANLMTASITASTSSSAADLLTDLKAGYLLGAHPRRQFVAQMMGVFAGTAASVLGYFLLVPDATVLTGTADLPAQFAAPAAQQWKAVAEVFRLGISNMHPMARDGIVIGLTVGVALALAEFVTPKNARQWLPSATGIGLGLILPFSTSLSFLLGAIGASLFEAFDKKRADRFVVPVASGLIAGESIMGIVVAALDNFVLT